MPGTCRSVTVKIASLVAPSSGAAFRAREDPGAREVPRAREPAGAVEVTSTEFEPGCRLRFVENAPEESAMTVVIEVVGVASPGAVPVWAMSTVGAPGTVVPDTGTDAASTVTDGLVRFIGTSPPLTVSGAVTLNGIGAAEPVAPPRYRSATIDGWSARRPDAKSAISRSNCAWAQVEQVRPDHVRLGRR